jgi:magnesium chelatase family protein
MLARRLTTILPAMTLAEAIETTRIHRVAGRTGDRTAWVTTRPCRAPHHTLSDAGLIGGGHVPMPGEVSLTPHGVRCLDARPACRRQVLSAASSTAAQFLLEDTTAVLISCSRSVRTGSIDASSTPTPCCPRCGMKC